MRTKDEVEKLQEPKRSEILSLHHSYVSKQTGRYIYFGDHSGYFNHSNTPNVGTKYKKDVEANKLTALMGLKIGEEGHAEEVVLIPPREFKIFDGIDG